MPTTPTMMSSTRKQPRDELCDDDAPAKRPSLCDLSSSSEWAPDWSSHLTCVRERLDSFNSDISDELDALDREMEAEAAAAANEATEKRLAASESPDATALGALEVDHAVTSIYEKMEEEAMLEILKELKDEFLAGGHALPVISDAPFGSTADAPSKSSSAPSSASSKKGAAVKPASCAAHESLLWDVVATPAMMRAFSEAVANGPAPVKVA